MGYHELDTDLPDEAKAMRETARKFGLEIMRPVGIELDRFADPSEVIAEGSLLYEVHKKFRELGFHKTGLPEAFGGMQENMPATAFPLIWEAMGYADAGLAISLTSAIFPFQFAMLSPDPEVQGLAKAFAEDTDANMIGCWALTEPDHGSDWIMGSLPDMNDSKYTPSVRAFMQQDEYILNGNKAAWVSNGTIATHAALHVSLDASKGMHGTGLAVIPLDLPGISRGRPLDKMGQRPLNQGEIVFDDVRIPKKYMIVTDPAAMTDLMPVILTAGNTGMGNFFSGLAQAAFDEALSYAKQRVQGGSPIIDHQNIKLKVVDMFTRVEAARVFARKVAQYNNANQPGSLAHAVASKTLATDTAFRVASEAIQIFGSFGLTRDCPVEKIFRDARTAMIEDGVNESLALVGARYL
ncbi:MAG: acyl-CoA dehydrogenase family protein [Dehalococcoidia bacterium]